MKLAELVSSFLKEGKDIYPFLGNKVSISFWMYQVAGHVLFNANFTEVCLLLAFVVYKWVTQHVIMLKEIFDKQDGIL